MRISKAQPDATIAVLGACAVALVLCACLLWETYRASVQAAVYRRQGVEMTTWEVMLGSKPVERTFREVDR